MADLVEKVVLEVQVKGKESIDAAAAAGERLVGVEEKITRAKRTTLDGLERMMASYDKQTRLIQQYGNALERLQRYERDSIGTAERRKEVYDKVTESFNRQFASLDGTAQRLDQLRAKYDPVTTSIRNMMKELQELNEARQKGIVIAGGYEAAERAIIEAHDEGIQAEKALAAAAEQHLDAIDPLRVALRSYETAEKSVIAAQKAGLLTTKEATAALKYYDDILNAPAVKKAKIEQDALTKSIETYKNVLNPTRQAQLDYIAQMDQIDKLVAKGNLSMLERTKLQEHYAGVLNKSIQESNGFKNSQNQAADGSRNLHFQLTNLSFQLNDVITGLTSGQDVMRVFAQQGGQIFQIFQQGGKALVAGILEWITPLTIAVTAVLALGAAFAIVLNRAFANEAQLRSFRVMLEGVSRGSETTAEKLQEITKELKALGLTADEAQKSVNAIIATPQINRGSVREIATTGLDIAARLQIPKEEGIKVFTQAIAGGLDSLIALGFQLDAVTQKQAAHAREAQRNGETIKALNEVVKLISGNVAGAYKRDLGAGTEAVIALGAAWDHMLDSLSKTRVIQGAKDALTQFFLAIGNLAAGGGEIKAPPLRYISPEDNAARAAAGLPPISPDASGIGIIAHTDPGMGKVDPRVIRAFNQAQLATGLQAQVYSTTSGSHAPNSMHYPENSPSGLGGALDFNIIDRTTGRVILHKEAHVAGSEAERVYAQFEQAFITAAGGGRSGSTFDPKDPGHVDIKGLPGTIGTGAVTAARGTPGAPGGGPVGEDPKVVEERAKAYALETRAQKDAITASKLRAIDQQAQIAYAQKYNELIDQNVPKTEAETRAAQAANAVRTVAVNELAKFNEKNDVQIKGIEATTEAFKVSEAEGYRVAAQEQARLEVMDTGNNLALRTRQILEESAASAVQAGQKQVAAALPQVAAAERVAEAAKGGAAAQHEAEIQAQVAVRTQDALAKATAAGNPAIIAQAAALNKAADAEIRRNEAAKARLANTEAIRTERQTQEQAQLQINLQGQTSEAIQTQVALLRTKNELDKLGNSLTDEEKKLRLDAVAATGKMNEKLAEATREQQRFEDAIRSVASAIESQLTSAIEAAFSGKKVESWGERIKKMLPQLAAQITDALFIKPALGSLASIFSPNLGAQMGTLAGIGSLGGLFGSSGSQTLTGTVGGQPASFSLSNVSGGLNILDKIGGELGIGGSSSGGGGFFSGIGSSVNSWLGSPFASSVPVSNIFGIEASTLSNVGLTGSVTIPGSVFGTTSIGSALGGVGAGFGAGMLVNTLAGGKPLGGTIGSGVGSLAGMALGSLIGMPFLGALLGGAGGGLLGGMFGNSKPSNASAGGNIDFATGKITGVFSGGNQQIDQATLQAVQSLGNITSNILAISGGKLSGNVLLQNGVNTGFTADSTLPNFSGRFSLGKDATQAVNVASLAIVKSLTDVSATMRTVIDQITDAADIENALKFAKVYDDLKTAFDGAFSSIAQDAKVVGPFSLALDQLKTTFKDLTDNATKFGLSLDPVNAGLVEATKRLNESFELFIQQQEIGSTGQSEYLSPAFAAHQQFLQNINDANALGLNTPAMTARITAIEQNVLRTIFEPLTNKQLQIVIDAFKTLAPEVSDFAQSMMHAADAANDAAVSTDNLYASLIELRTQLTTGPSSGLTVQQQLTAANDNFAKTLALVQGGNTSQIGTLATQGSNLIALSEQTYGNAPQTSTIRTAIVAGLNAILTAQGFATGTKRTPPGMILVGEQGPELISQPGGLQVFSAADTAMMLSAPQGNSELVAKLDMVIALLAGGNTIAREHGAISERGFNTLTGQVEEMTQPAFEPPARRTAA